MSANSAHQRGCAKLGLSRFRLCRPASLDEACRLHRELGENAALLAGGTELILAMKLGLASSQYLIDLKRLPELHGIDLRDGSLRIGATETHMEIERDAHVRELIPALADLEGAIGNVRVRSAGTLGGNLCFGEPHGDPPPLLMALGADLEITNGTSIRHAPLTDFMTGAYTNSLGSDEVVVAIVVPVPDRDTRVAYVNFRVLERPTVGVAVVGRVTDGRFSEPPRIFVGAADNVPRRVDSGVLAGSGAGDLEALDQLAKAASESIEPHDDLGGSAEYKRHIAGVLARRAARKALERSAA